MKRLIIPIVILLFLMKHMNMFPRTEFISQNSNIWYGIMIAAVFIVVAVQGKKIIAVKEIETSQSEAELMARNKSAIKTITGEDVTSDKDNKANHFPKHRSFWFYTKKEFDNE